MSKQNENLYIIIDEVELEIIKNDKGHPAIFETEAAAEIYASERLNIWIVFELVQPGTMYFRFLTDTIKN